MAHKPAVILTTQRTGGSFLAFCLSNHTDIFCTRGEPLSPRSFWVDAAPDPVERLHALLHQQYYSVSMCKLIDSHAFNQKGIWEYIVKNNVAILYLERKYILAQAVSHEINVAKSRGEITGHPTHAFGEVDLPMVELEPNSIIERCNSERARYRRLRKMLEQSSLSVMRLTYEQITGGGIEALQIPTVVGCRICEFLGVEYQPLKTKMRKVHKASLSKTVSNWAQIVDALKGTRWEVK